MSVRFVIKNEPLSKNALKLLNNSYIWKCNEIGVLFLPSMNNVIAYLYAMVTYQLRVSLVKNEIY